LIDIQPLLAHMQAAIDPHPTFGSIELTMRLWQGKPRLDPVVRDESENVEVTDPGKTLSTSQANALAVALFLAFNLGLQPTMLQTIVLDDPLQNLDDVHLLVVTTHDSSFASLLCRKLRPT
jgi:hypothetical protein